ncbi:DUF4304 domain-containing protein [Parabacteroides sp. FAFU027]|uniref:DUF4304 domain-containing protein n=1 Tax=Parabacteroides sp. FAFU027 TaxID=2922715 RepID=UPI001FAF4B73|nr:DUF4304 domain-containing protein [Parabacteroides sp. FAFU027]
MTPDNLKTDFDEIFKGIIIPFFKDLGFRRKAQHFSRQTNDITQCFTVQKSQWNSYNDSLSFTFNLGFYNEEIRTLSLGRELPTNFPKTTDCFIYDRLGSYSHKCDHWYELSKRVDRTKVAGQVKSDLEKYLKPLFEEYKSLDDLKRYSERNTGFLLSPYGKIVFLMMTDQMERGKQLIKEQHKLALTPQMTTQIINYPDGRKEEKKSKPYINQYYVDHIERLARHYDIEL